MSGSSDSRQKVEAPRRAAPDGRAISPTSRPRLTRAKTRLVAGAAAAGVAAAAYMAFEAQWVRCRRADLPAPGFPAPWSGLTVLHLADVHAGTFRSNDRCLGKVVRWAEKLSPDLVFLTGDILGDPKRSRTGLELLARLQPRLGTFAVTGNHEYGLGKGPLAHPLDTAGLWAEAGITLLSDRCLALPPREGTRVVLCGADYISGGYGLLNGTATCLPDDFPILLIHEPPPRDSPLALMFPLVFAGHTHGGQLRVPSRSGLVPLHKQGGEYSTGATHWTAGTMVVSPGIGTSFLPLRLLTRPEATLWRLVYTSPEYAVAADQ